MKITILVEQTTSLHMSENRSTLMLLQDIFYKIPRGYSGNFLDEWDFWDYLYYGLMLFSLRKIKICNHNGEEEERSSITEALMLGKEN